MALMDGQRLTCRVRQLLKRAAKKKTRNVALTKGPRNDGVYNSPASRIAARSNYDCCIRSPTKAREGESEDYSSPLQRPVPTEDDTFMPHVKRINDRIFHGGALTPR